MSDVKSWMDSARLKLNGTKTELIIMCSKQHIDAVDVNSIDINGVKVKRVNSVQYLGVHIDCHFNLKHHIAVKYKTAMYSILRIRNIRRSLTVEAAYTLVLSMVISHLEFLDYANALYFILPDVDINKL